MLAKRVKMYAEVMALCSVTVNNSEPSKRCEASKVPAGTEIGRSFQSSNLIESSHPKSCDGFIGVDRRCPKHKKFFISGTAETVKESQIYL